MNYKNLTRSIFALFCMNYIIARSIKEESKLIRSIRNESNGGKYPLKPYFQQGMDDETSRQARSMVGNSQVHSSERYYDISEEHSNRNSAQWLVIKQPENQSNDLEMSSSEEMDTDLMPLKRFQKRLKRKAKKSSKTRHKGKKSITKRKSSADTSQQFSKEKRSKKRPKSSTIKISQTEFEKSLKDEKLNSRSNEQLRKGFQKKKQTVLKDDKSSQGSLKVYTTNTSSKENTGSSLKNKSLIHGPESEDINKGMQKEMSEEESSKKTNTNGSYRSHKKGFMNRTSRQSLKESFLEDTDERMSKESNLDIESVDSMPTIKISVESSKKALDHSVNERVEKMSKNDNPSQTSDENKINKDIFSKANSNEGLNNIKLEDGISQVTSVYIDNEFTQLYTKKGLNEESLSKESSVSELTTDKSSKTKSRKKSNNDISHKKKSDKHSFEEMSSKKDSREEIRLNESFMENSNEVSLEKGQTKEKSKEMSITEDGFRNKNFDQSDLEDKPPKKSERTHFTEKKSRKTHSHKYKTSTDNVERDLNAVKSRSANSKNRPHKHKSFKSNSDRGRFEDRSTSDYSSKKTNNKSFEKLRRRNKSKTSSSKTSASDSSKSEFSKERSIKADRIKSVDDRVSNRKSSEPFHSEKFDEQSSKTNSFQETSFGKSNEDKSQKSKVKASNTPAKGSTKTNSNENISFNDNSKTKREQDKSYKETSTTVTNENKDLSFETNVSQNSALHNLQNEISKTLLSEAETSETNIDNSPSDSFEKATKGDNSRLKISNGLFKDSFTSHQFEFDKDFNIEVTTRPTELYDTESKKDEHLLSNSKRVSETISFATGTHDLISQTIGPASLPGQVSLMSQKHLTQTSSSVSNSNTYYKQIESLSYSSDSQMDPVTQSTLRSDRTTGLVPLSHDKTRLTSNSVDYLSQTKQSSDIVDSTSSHVVESATDIGKAMSESNKSASINVTHLLRSQEHKTQSQNSKEVKHEHASDIVGSVLESQEYASLNTDVSAESQKYATDILSSVLQKKTSKTQSPLQSKHAIFTQHTLHSSTKPVSNTKSSLPSQPEEILNIDGSLQTVSSVSKMNEVNERIRPLSQTVNSIPDSRTTAPAIESSIDSTETYLSPDARVELSKQSTEFALDTSKIIKENIKLLSNALPYLSPAEKPANLVDTIPSGSEGLVTDSEQTISKILGSVLDSRRVGSNSIDTVTGSHEYALPTDSFTQITKDRETNEDKSDSEPSELESSIVDTMGSFKHVSQTLGLSSILQERIPMTINTVESTFSFSPNTVYAKGDNLSSSVQGSQEQMSIPGTSSQTARSVSQTVSTMPHSKITSVSESIKESAEDQSTHATRPYPSKGKTKSFLETSENKYAKISFPSGAREDTGIPRQEMSLHTAYSTSRKRKGSISEPRQTKSKLFGSILKSNTLASTSLILALTSQKHAVNTEDFVTVSDQPKSIETGSVVEQVVDSSPGLQTRGSRYSELSSPLQVYFPQTKFSMQSKHSTRTHNTVSTSWVTQASTKSSTLFSLEQLPKPIMSSQATGLVSDLNDFNQDTKPLPQTVNSMPNSPTTEPISTRSMDDTEKQFSEASSFTPDTPERNMHEVISVAESKKHAEVFVESSSDSQMHTPRMLDSSLDFHEHIIKTKFVEQSRPTTLTQSTALPSVENLLSTERVAQNSPNQLSTPSISSHTKGVNSLSDPGATSPLTKSSKIGTGRDFTKASRSEQGTGMIKSVLVSAEYRKDGTSLAKDPEEYISDQKMSSNTVSRSQRFKSSTHEFEYQNIDSISEWQDTAPQTADSNERHTSKFSSMSQKYATQEYISGQNTPNNAPQTRYSTLSEALSRGANSAESTQKELSIPDTSSQKPRSVSNSYDELVSRKQFEYQKSLDLESGIIASKSLIHAQELPTQISNSDLDQTIQYNVESYSVSPKQAPHSLRPQELTSQTLKLSNSGTSVLATDSADSISRYQEQTSQTLKSNSGTSVRATDSADSISRSQELTSQTVKSNSGTSVRATDSADSISRSQELTSQTLKSNSGTSVRATYSADSISRSQELTSQTVKSNSGTSVRATDSADSISRSQELTSQTLNSNSGTSVRATDSADSISRSQELTSQTLKSNSGTSVRATDSADSISRSKELTSQTLKSNSGTSVRATDSADSISRYQELTSQTLMLSNSGTSVRATDSADSISRAQELTSQTVKSNSGTSVRATDSAVSILRSQELTSQTVKSNSGTSVRATDNADSISRSQELTSQTLKLSKSGTSVRATDSADSVSRSKELTSQTINSASHSQKNRSTRFGFAPSSRELEYHTTSLASQKHTAESAGTVSNLYELNSQKTVANSETPAQGVHVITSRVFTSSPSSHNQGSVLSRSSSHETATNVVGPATSSQNHAMEMLRSYSKTFEKHTTLSTASRSSLQDQVPTISVSATGSQEHRSNSVSSVSSSHEHTSSAFTRDSTLPIDASKSGSTSLDLQKHLSQPTVSVSSLQEQYVSRSKGYTSGLRGHLSQKLAVASASKTESVPETKYSKQPFSKQPSDVQTNYDKNQEYLYIPDKEDSKPGSGQPHRPLCDKPHICTLQTTACCVPGELFVNLTEDRGGDDQFATGELEGVSLLFIRPTLQNRRYACAFGVLATVDFEKIDSGGCFGSLESPYCGRRMLKVTLELSHAKRNGWLFHIADSNFHNRFTNSSGKRDELNEAEVQGFYPNITVYPSDKCPCIEALMQLIDGVASPAKTITFYISNQHIRIENDAGLRFKLSHRCLFALNGQHDIEGSNERVYIGVNRVVQDKSLAGYGVCSATISWACPWHN